MEKIPYKFNQLLATISPAAPIVVYEDGEMGFDELYKGIAIKSRDRDDLLDLEVKHIGVNERNKEKDCGKFILEIFLYVDRGQQSPK